MMEQVFNPLHQKQLGPAAVLVGCVSGQSAAKLGVLRVIIHC